MYSFVMKHFAIICSVYPILFSILFLLGQYHDFCGTVLFYDILLSSVLIL